MKYYVKQPKAFDSVIVHEMANASLKGKYESHEQLFIRSLYKQYLKENSDLAIIFMMFAVQYFSDYPWIKFDLNDPIGSVVLECYYNDFAYSFMDDNLISEARQDSACKFGQIVTEFFIRFLNCSLIGSQEEHIIITAQSNCDKLFEQELLKDYKLQRMAKVGYIKLAPSLKALYPTIDGYFYYLPVMPTKDLGYSIDEIIEVQPHQYVKVL